MFDLLILSDPHELTVEGSECLPSHTLLLYDPKESESADALAEFSSERFGERLYVPPRFADAAPDAQVWTPCSIFGAPLAQRLRAHRAQWGSRAVAVIFPIEQAVTLSPNQAARFGALPESLPEQNVFSGGECAYQVVPDGDGWTFYLFDTEQTLHRRCALCEQLDLPYLVIERRP